MTQTEFVSKIRRLRAAGHDIHGTQKAVLARWKRRHGDWAPYVERILTSAERYTLHLSRAVKYQVHDRGGETTIEEQGRSIDLGVIDREGGQVLVGCNGWRKYGSKSWRATLRYVGGIDDNGAWAVRVPGTCDNVRSAMAWITPADVWQAQRSGRRVLRQGDIYAIETVKSSDGNGTEALGDSHHWDPETRTLSHDDGHAPVVIQYPVRFVRQRQLGMGRGGRWGSGD